MAYWYPVTSTIGGAAGSLDSIDGATLSDGDRAILITDTGVRFYRLDATSGAAESDPDVIAPDLTPGTKRWILVGTLGSGSGGGSSYYVEEGTPVTTESVVTAIKSWAFGENNTIWLDSSNTTDGLCAILSGELNEIINITYGRSVIGGGDNNQLKFAENCGIFSGYLNKIVGVSANQPYNCVIAGGQSNQIYCTNGGTDNSILGGDSNHVFDTSLGGNYSLVCGGQNNEVYGADFASILGGKDVYVRLHGQSAYSAGKFTDVGDCQYSTLMGRIITTDATQTEMFLDGSSAALVIYYPKVYRFTIEALAVQTGGTAGTAEDTAFWTINGAVKQSGTFVGTPQGTGTPAATDCDAAAAAWQFNVTAEASYIRFKATGEANKTIRWCFKISLVEIKRA